jgi:23S rRNA (adenine2503-C2)-methyltransferase
MGLHKEINGVPNGNIMPLENKWVITMSTQYGCSMDCKFCDVPKVGRGVNVTFNDLYDQLIDGIKLHPEIKHTKRLNIHYARMGEPTFNLNVLDFTYEIKNIIKPLLGDSLFHPVISTMMPKYNNMLESYLLRWTGIKNCVLNGDAGLQLSINSTNEEQRNDMFSGNALSLESISDIGRSLPNPIGRKYALNFALADNYEVDAYKLRNYFDPEKFMIKITPLHKTISCEENKIKTTGGYEYFTPYQQIEQKLKDYGFDVLVFVPSYEEDLGRITCGNAILSGSLPECDYNII